MSDRIRRAFRHAGPAVILLMAGASCGQPVRTSGSGEHAAGSALSARLEAVAVCIVSEGVPTVVEPSPDRLRVRFPAGVPLSMGTGAFISPDGDILTCAHLFTAAQAADPDYTAAVIARSGASGAHAVIRARITRIDADRDLAVLASGRSRDDWLRIATTPPRSGDPVASLGVRSGFRLGVHRGALFSLSRFDLDSRKGDSGSPIVDGQGDLVSVLTEGDFNDTLGVRIPIPTRGAPLASLHRFLAQDPGRIP